MPKESPTTLCLSHLSVLAPKPLPELCPQPPALGTPTVPIPVAGVALPGQGGRQHNTSLAVLCFWLASEGSLRRAAVDDPHPQSQARSRGCSEYMGQGRW